jgi:hypothetical protein
MAPFDIPVSAADGRPLGGRADVRIRGVQAQHEICFLLGHAAGGHKILSRGAAAGHADGDVVARRSRPLGAAGLLVEPPDQYRQTRIGGGQRGAEFADLVRQARGFGENFAGLGCRSAPQARTEATVCTALVWGRSGWLIALFL